MLPAAHRLRRSADFTAVVGSGRRIRSGAVVVHQVAAPADDEDASTPAVVGLIVGRGIGGSVVRHRVSRRLRAQLAIRLDRLGAGSATVVRALPPAAAADSAALGRDLDRALERLRRPVPSSADSQPDPTRTERR